MPQPTKEEQAKPAVTGNTAGATRLHRPFSHEVHKHLGFGYAYESDAEYLLGELAKRVRAC